MSIPTPTSSVTIYSAEIPYTFKKINRGNKFIVPNPYHGFIIIFPFFKISIKKSTEYE